MCETGTADRGFSGSASLTAVCRLRGCELSLAEYSHCCNDIAANNVLKDRCRINERCRWAVDGKQCFWRSSSSTSSCSNTPPQLDSSRRIVRRIPTDSSCVDPPFLCESTRHCRQFLCESTFVCESTIPVWIHHQTHRGQFLCARSLAGPDAEVAPPQGMTGHIGCAMTCTLDEKCRHFNHVSSAANPAMCQLFYGKPVTFDVSEHCQHYHALPAGARLQQRVVPFDVLGITGF